MASASNSHILAGAPIIVPRAYADTWRGSRSLLNHDEAPRRAPRRMIQPAASKDDALKITAGSEESSDRPSRVVVDDLQPRPEEDMCADALRAEALATEARLAHRAAGFEPPPAMLTVTQEQLREGESHAAKHEQEHSEAKPVEAIVLDRSTGQVVGVVPNFNRPEWKRLPFLKAELVSAGAGAHGTWHRRRTSHETAPRPTGARRRTASGRARAGPDDDPEPGRAGRSVELGRRLREIAVLSAKAVELALIHEQRRAGARRAAA